MLSRAPWTDEVSHTFGRVKADLEMTGARLEDFDVAVAAHALTFDATGVRFIASPPASPGAPS